MEASWKSRLLPEFQEAYMVELRAFLHSRISSGAVVYPTGSNIFNALDSTPFEKVRVVIIGQDPYHGPGQAHGLCFSVRLGVPTPPSLMNIFKEIESDLEIPPADHGNLSSWAEQGVLLLNSVLTVEKGNAGAHQGKGWERFTDQVIQLLNDEQDALKAHLDIIDLETLRDSKAGQVSRREDEIKSRQHEMKVLKKELSAIEKKLAVQKENLPPQTWK